ncbi:MAG: hypothetical protein HY319_02080 [Armatimonadetes bacterium]|nr:hypothetical protein [Armatimonadota bacterium]
MPVTIWDYEAVRIQAADPAHVREVLRPFGERGFQMAHVHTHPDGSLMIILARNTGRPVDESDELTSPVFTDSQMEMIAINWTP